MDSVDDYRAEIETLHAFFVEWYTGVADESDFQTVEDALGPSFEMVTPGGEVHERAAITSAIRESFGTYDVGEFDIDIRNVELVTQYDGVTLVRYEEWQDDTEGTNGRLSTALFAPASGTTTDRRFEWQYLQETWLER